MIGLAMKLLQEAVELTKKQWQLLFVNVVLTLIFQSDFGLIDSNQLFFFLSIIPFILYAVFCFCLIKLVYEKKEHPQLPLSHLISGYIKLIPRLFFPMIGIILLLIVAVFVSLTILNGIVLLLGFEGPILFDQNNNLVNYLLAVLFFTISGSLITFQSVLYFLENQSFFRALKNSVPLALKHLKVVSIVAVLYAMTILLSGFLNVHIWYQAVIVGVVNGILYFYILVYILLYYLKEIKDTHSRT